MPLNSSHLHHSIVEIIRDIPYDRESAPDFTYQTKVDLYDSKCSGCGFVRIEVYPANTYDTKPKVFRDINEAIAYARYNGCRINRTCDYMFDTIEKNGKNVYPTLTEIVSNTCDFWNQEKILSFIECKFDEENTINLIELLGTNGET